MTKGQNRQIQRRQLRKSEKLCALTRGKMMGHTIRRYYGKFALRGKGDLIKDQID